MADSADVTRMLNTVRVRCPGATDASIRWEYYGALNEFLQESNIWQQTVSMPVDTTTKTWALPALPVTPASVHRLINITASDGTQRNGSMQTVGTILLDNTPSAVDTYKVTAVTVLADPTDSDTNPSAPTWITNKYNNDLTEGVAGRLMAQQAKPYSNTTLAVYYLKRFQAAIAKASVEARHQNIYGGQRWRFPRGYQTRRTQPWLGPV